MTTKVGWPRSITSRVLPCHSDLKAAKLSKIARRVVQKLDGLPSEGMQKLYMPGQRDKRFKMEIMERNAKENLCSLLCPSKTECVPIVIASDIRGSVALPKSRLKTQL